MSAKHNIFKYVTAFHGDMRDDEHHRYKSWEHCYQFFNSSPKDKNLAGLHLGFYLASWGMYRGSSFLLQKDYKAHEAVAVELLKPQYKTIRGIDITKITDDEIKLIFALKSWIGDWYKQNLTHTKKINVTDTLATKIMLGTLGCIPAYDRFFIDGIRSEGLTFSNLNTKNFKQLIEFCMDNQKQFEKARQSISNYGIEYPFMKVVDMYFWRIGYERSLKQ